MKGLACGDGGSACRIHLDADAADGTTRQPEEAVLRRDHAGVDHKRLGTVENGMRRTREPTTAVWQERPTSDYRRSWRRVRQQVPTRSNTLRAGGAAPEQGVAAALTAKGYRCSRRFTL